MEKGRYSIEIHIDFIDKIMSLDFVNQVRQYGCQNLMYLIDHVKNERLFFKGLGIFDVNSAERVSIDHKFTEENYCSLYGSFRRHRNVDYVLNLFEENDPSIFREINVHINREFYEKDTEDKDRYSYYYMSGTESVVPKLELASLLFKTKLNYTDYDPSDDENCSVSLKYYDPSNIIRNDNGISESFLYKCTLDVYRKYKGRFVFMDNGTKAFLLFSKFANFTEAEIKEIKDVGGSFEFDKESIRYLIKSKYLNKNFENYLIGQLNESKCSSYKKLNAFFNRLLNVSVVNDRLERDIKELYDFKKWFKGSLDPKVAENFIKVINRNKDKKVFHLITLFKVMFGDTIEWDKMDSSIFDELFPNGFVEGKYKLGNVVDEEEIIMIENKELEPLIPYYFEPYQRVFQMMSIVKFLDIAEDAEFNFYKNRIVELFEIHIRVSTDFTGKVHECFKSNTLVTILDKSDERTRLRMKKIFREVQLMVRKNGTKANYIRLVNFISTFGLDEYFDTKIMGATYKKILFESKLK